MSLAKFFEFQRQTVAKGTFGPQFFQQQFGTIE
jgi:hypothetical protein